MREEGIGKTVYNIVMKMTYCKTTMYNEYSQWEKDPELCPFVSFYLVVMNNAYIWCLDVYLNRKLNSWRMGTETLGRKASIQQALGQIDNSNFLCKPESSNDC